MKLIQFDGVGANCDFSLSYIKKIKTPFMPKIFINYQLLDVNLDFECLLKSLKSRMFFQVKNIHFLSENSKKNFL